MHASHHDVHTYCSYLNPCQGSEAMALVFSQEMAVHMFFNHNVFIMQGLLTSIQVCSELIYRDRINRAADKLPVQVPGDRLRLFWSSKSP